jgi:oligopeptide transport system substrate-binding protein
MYRDPYYWAPRPSRRPGRNRSAIFVGGAILLSIVVAVGMAWRPDPTSSASGAPRNSITILGASAASLDPAIQSDAGSAQIVSQVFDSLTAIDASGRTQPALAASWTTSNGGKQITFHLRDGLTFSDGSPLTAADVVTSWLRVLAPPVKGQLASLLDDVVGARAYREGSGPQSAVGLKAVNTTDFEVDLASPAGDFAAIASSPSLAVVPPKLDSDPSLLQPGSTFVGSGAYVVSALTDTETTLQANTHYWGGTPAIQTIHLLSSIGGKSPVSEFQAGNLDYTPISDFDASWIMYDKTLGPDLRVETSPSVEYYGFDTSKAPFSDVHVRRAFAEWIDWRRIVALLGNPLEVSATGMVPIGVPGHSASDYGPKFDLAAAKTELAAAGFPNGAGFPKITLVTGGAALDTAIVQQLHDNLGIDIGYQTLDWQTYNARLLTDPPAMWQMGWVADYPGANDFLGLLLGTGKTNNFGRWSNPTFDSDVSAALAATDPASMQKSFDAAEGVVADQAPVIPVDNGGGYSLARAGLLGALPNGQGLVRYAGMAWATGS